VIMLSDIPGADAGLIDGLPHQAWFDAPIAPTLPPGVETTLRSTSMWRSPCPRPDLHRSHLT
jgi:hypothetical protein